MEFEYSKKDIKKSPKVKSDIWEEDGIFYFTLKGETHGFTLKENAEIALKRLKNE